MLFWIFVAMFVVGFIFGWRKSDVFILHFTYHFGWIASICAFAILIAFHLPGGTYSPEHYESVYADLTYKIESGSCRDNNGYLTENMIDEINEYNDDLEFFQKNQGDFWIGIFLPNRYNTLQIISLEQANQPVGKQIIDNYFQQPTTKVVGLRSSAS